MASELESAHRADTGLMVAKTSQWFSFALASLPMKHERTSVWLLRFRGSREGAKRNLNPPGGSPDRITWRRSGLLFGRLGRPPETGRLVNQSQLAVALSCGLTTSVRNDFARAIAEREAHECKTQSYSDIQHRETKAGGGVWFCPRGFSSIKWGHRIFQIRTIETRTRPKLPMFAPPLGSARLWIIQT